MRMTDGRKKAWKDSDLFSGVFPETEETVLTAGVLLEKEAGERVELPGAGLCFVLNGAVVALNRDGKKDTLLNRFGSGDLFGAVSLFAGEDGSVFSEMVAKSRTALLFLGENTVRELIAKDPKFAENYVIYLTDKLRFLNRKISGYTAKNTKESLLGYLRELCREQGSEGTELNVARAAKMLGFSRQAIYTALSSLIREGRVRKEGKNLVPTVPEGTEQPD